MTQETDPAVFPPTPDSDSVSMVAGACSCVHCSYELRGLPITGQCPECGLPIADSLKGFLLQHAAPEYIKKITGGLSLVLNMILLMVASFIAMIFVASVLLPTTALTGRSFQFIAQLVMFLISIGSALGYYRFSEPDPGYAVTEQPNAARSVLRITVIVSVILGTVGLAIGIGGGAAPFSFGMPIGGAAPARPGTAPAAPLLMLVSVALVLLGLAAWAVQFVCTIRYTRWLASRVPDQKIIKRCRTYIWLLPLLTTVGYFACGLGPLIALILYWNILDRLRKHLKSIIATGQPRPLAKLRSV
jgi:hypothetical protein